jgi:8-oxo-dGTP diphosphatase
MARWGEQAENPSIPACYLILEKPDGEWLFVLREDTGYMDGDYGLIGGSVEPGESFDEGAVREGAEEAGVTVRTDDIRLVHVMHRNKAPETKPDGTAMEPRIDTYWLTHVWSGKPVNGEPQRHAAIQWLDPDALPVNVVDFQAVAIKAIREGKPYSRFGW